MEMRSRALKQCFPFFVLGSLCIAAFLVFSDFTKTSMDPDASRLIRLKTSMKKHVQLDGRVTSRDRDAAISMDGRTGKDNSTALPDDCFQGLLRSVDPTCVLGDFCTKTWRQEDVLCHVFFHQAALVPGPAQCDLGLDQQELDGERYTKEENKTVIPRIAYYVLMSKSCREPYEFHFVHYLSVRSVQTYLRPRAIYVLGNCVPVGYWWSRVVSDARSVRFVYRPQPHLTEDGRVKWLAHLSDVIRLQVLLVNGGVYLDTDMILLRSLDPLFRFPLTMGLVDLKTGMGNALMLATRGNTFIKEWYSGYKHFRADHFHHNGMWEALRLWRANPDRVHMETKRFYSPNWYEAQLLFGNGSNYDMSDSYAVHVWHNHNPVPTEPEQLLGLNSTLGKVLRRIYYDV